MVSTARSYSDTASAFTLPSPKDGWLRDEDVVQVIAEALGAAIVRLRERIAATEKPDPVTQDLLIGITAELEKQRWMFEAENGPRGS